MSNECHKISEIYENDKIDGNNKIYKDVKISINIIDKDYYILQTFQEQLDIICNYATALAQELNKPISDISRSDFLLIKKIFDFSNCRKELLDNSFEIIEFFRLCEVDLSAFLSYGVNTDTYKDSWGDTLLEILKKNDTMEFISIVWGYYRDKYFNPKNKNQRVTSFINFLDTYKKYSNLLKNIMKYYPIRLPNDIKAILDDLFNKTNRILLSFTKDIKGEISTPYELKEILYAMEDMVIGSILKSKNLDEKKEFICVLFSMDTATLKHLINTYGNTERLKLLQFNNRKNPYMVELIENILVMTSFIENVLSFETKEDFDSFVIKLKNNKEYLSTIKKMLSKYEKMMIRLYELESNYNLTNINRVCKEGKVDGKSIVKEYQGGESKVRVVDLHNCKYILYAHVMSYRETIDELVHGQDKENQVFISLSAISHRNQVYFIDTTNVILAYDYIPEGNFVLSSNTNLGSRFLIRKNSATLDPFSYEQLGILETSMSPYNNSEALVLREGLKPCGIIIPGLRNTTDEELAYSLKYNLPLIITQNKNKGIINPHDIEYTNDVEDTGLNNQQSYQKLSSVQDKLFEKPKSNKIGILTDINGMHEPTLAILEDMRRKGITEIYSLGNNIGFGPNPHEVLELLRQYNVKSIYGNHEIYSVDGMDALDEHMASLLPSTVNEYKKITEWTKNQLTSQDIDDIMKYDGKIVITRGGKKITLVHSRKKDLYEKQGHFTKPEIDENSIVIESIEEHEQHFEGEQKDDLKLRAAGMGFIGWDDGMTSYLIIEEDGSFSNVNIRYNIENFKESVNESSMGDEIRSIIDGFVRR